MKPSSITAVAWWKKRSLEKMGELRKMTEKKREGKRRGKIWFKVSRGDFSSLGGSVVWDSSQKIYFVSLFFSPADRREIPQRFFPLFWDFFAASQGWSLR